MKRYSLIMLLFALISTASSALSENKSSKLFLVGGGLKTCSSMAIKNCNSKGLAKDAAVNIGKTGALYQINEKTITLVKNSWPTSFEQQNLTTIINVLDAITERKANTEIINKSQLRSLFKTYDHKRIIHNLNDKQYYLLLDLLEQPVLAPNSNQRLKEQVALVHSNNEFSNELYFGFVQLAREISSKPTPNIIVLTASARDPFEAADFYQTVFTQAGGNTKWLPLDATLNATFQQEGNRADVCKQLSSLRVNVQGSINRGNIYPDLVNQQMQACLSPQSILKSIANADGIFINGGDQSLTVKAFINEDGSDSKALTLIKEKLANNSLIIGGTSAGTAVMSGGRFNAQAIPMITNGQSKTAIVRGAKKDHLPTAGCHKSNSCQNDVISDDLTFNSHGGLGLFHWGIMDTHFSERGRQGRLAKLVLDTETQFAFGVDEATALLVDKINSASPQFRVLGQSGVFIVENTTNSETKNTVNTHYVTHGDQFSLSKGKLAFDFAPWKTVSVEQQTLTKTVKQIFKGARYKNTSEVLCRTDNNKINGQSSWHKSTSQIVIEKQEISLSRYGILSLDESERGYCSYQNYQLTITEQ